MELYAKEFVISTDIIWPLAVLILTRCCFKHYNGDALMVSNSIKSRG